MSDRQVDHLLIGGGIASVSCAETLRAQNASGSVMIVSRELDPPYHRPPVSKALLTSDRARGNASLRPPRWYADHGIELKTRTSVVSLDPVAKVVRLSTKEEVSYETALLATGAKVRRLQIEGSQLEGIYYLRALSNAEAVRVATASAEHVVCIGGSYIGCEVAASLTASGNACTIVMLESEPVERGFGRRVGRHVRDVLQDHGVQVIGDAEVAQFVGSERVTAVVLSDGRRLPADLVICGTGAVPDTTLAARAGIPLGAAKGVACDSRLRTPFDGLYAAGDMCEYDSALHGGLTRIEHERVAEAQGRLVARNMLGADEPFVEVPSFWSDLADWVTLEYVGLGGPVDNEMVAGDPDSGRFSSYQMCDGRLVGAVSLAGHGNLTRAAELIASRDVADLEQLMPALSSP